MYQVLFYALGIYTVINKQRKQSKASSSWSLLLKWKASSKEKNESVEGYEEKDSKVRGYRVMEDMNVEWQVSDLIFEETA